MLETLSVIHGELLKLGIEISETTVAKYMIKRRGPPSQAWRTFLDNHAIKGSWRTGRPFGLSAGNGDDLWLLETDRNGNPVAFVDHVEFAGADPDRTLGRWLDGAGYDALFPTYATQEPNFVHGAQAVELFLKSGMDREQRGAPARSAHRHQ